MKRKKRSYISALEGEWLDWYRLSPRQRWKDKNSGLFLLKWAVHLILNPIHKVLSVLHSCGVRFLLMGGQACILYGAAEFSRDTDIVVLAETSNLKRLRRALSKLRAECIAVPPLSVNLQSNQN
jgi:hypothetical protein